MTLQPLAKYDYGHTFDNAQRYDYGNHYQPYHYLYP